MIFNITILQTLTLEDLVRPPYHTPAICGNDFTVAIRQCNIRLVLPHGLLVLIGFCDYYVRGSLTWNCKHQTVCLELDGL